MMANFPLELENNFTAPTRSCPNWDIIPVIGSQRCHPLSGRAPGWSSSWMRMLTVQHSVVHSGEHNVCGHVLGEELQGIQLSQ